MSGSLHPERLPDELWPPRGGLAPDRERPLRRLRHRALAQSRSPRRARHDGLGVLRRRPIARPGRRVPAGRANRSADPAECDGSRDHAHRPDRDGVDDLQLAVQPCPAVCLARSRERWTRRLEHRHDGRPRLGGQLRARGPARPCRPVRARNRLPRGCTRVVGQLGRRRDRRRQGVGPVHAGGRRSRDRPRRRLLQRPRAVECPPVAAGSPGARAGRLVRRREGVRGGDGRGDLHGAADARGRPGLLR